MAEVAQAILAMIDNGGPVYLAEKGSIDANTVATTDLIFPDATRDLASFAGLYAQIKYTSGTFSLAVIKIKNTAGDNSPSIPLATLTSGVNIIVPLFGSWGNSGNISVEVTTPNGSAAAFIVTVHGVKLN